MKPNNFEGEQLKAGERIPCKDPVCRIGTCTCYAKAEELRSSLAKAMVDAAEEREAMRKRCPECNREMRAVTSRTPEGAWKCDHCASNWRPVCDRCRHDQGDHRGEACWVNGCYCQGFQKTTKPPQVEEISLEGGKYLFRLHPDYRLECLRHGEPWRDFVGDKAIHALFNFAFESSERFKFMHEEARWYMQDGNLDRLEKAIHKVEAWPST